MASNAGHRRRNTIHGVAVDVTSQPLLQGLPAQLDARCRVLVLGSMPGVASLQAARYYAHPRNRFWPLMGALCGFDPALDYPERLHCLREAGVGLWDVIGRCRRRGSLDAAIVRGSEVPNPLPATLQALPQLRVVACNGAAAMQAFARHVRPELPAGWALPVLALPSTSPANAAWSLARLRCEWERLAPWLPTAGHIVS
ncbi:DNA-deoxyinosine glycosylase [Stenotrophomonas mori]|uniref:DNA-deoxyinosine glycosylase n=1 Tax=Stenotrophomonas mori TaxID=2871096 RepID=A0ABT0SJW9_9GAMM|nr:DNA-deoxyinosine glycosylase [Stenotrophomonas mori]MCL7715280.1 DNA-deoxyinosine glycosylase [Stenotrophomonas mori]